MNTVIHNLEAVKRRISAAAMACGRSPGEIRLLAVSKAQATCAVLDAWAAGQRAFGENYVDESMERMDALPDAEWHYIGALQSNKTRVVAQRFAWVQTVDRAKLVARLSNQRPAGMSALQVCIQVNIDDELSKAGCRPGDVLALARLVADAPRLRLRGLMAIPRAAEDSTRLRASFAAMRSLFQGCQDDGLEMDTLSMGMSGDLELAIMEGATLVRVGTALFGERP